MPIVSPLVLCLQPPFDAESEEELFPAILTEEVLFPVWLSANCVSIIKGFLTKNRVERLGCGPAGEQEIRGHSFFEGIDWEKLEQRKVKPPFEPVIVSISPVFQLVGQESPSVNAALMASPALIDFIILEIEKGGQ